MAAPTRPETSVLDAARLVVIEADASYKFRHSMGAVAGIAWRLVASSRPGEIATSTVRHLAGPNMAELKAIRFGLEHALKEGYRHAVVKSDSEWCINILNRKWNPRLEYTIESVDGIRGLIEMFTCVEFVHVPTKLIKKVDKAARDAMEDRITELYHAIRLRNRRRSRSRRQTWSRV